MKHQNIKYLENEHYVFFHFINGDEVSEHYIQSKLPKTLCFT